MNDEFQQTVNLRPQKTKPAPSAKAATPKPLASPPAKQRQEEIDEVFRSQGNGEDYRKISRPRQSNGKEIVFKRISLILIVFLVGIVSYLLFFQKSDSGPQAAGRPAEQSSWYSVKLVNGDIFYGKVEDIAADPVIMKNVYYDYDQVKKTEGVTAEENKSGSLRLVKRGKETHGPDGTMNIVRGQILFMEPLKEDSKVLRAILDYEK
jgi:hypothetical protein